MRAHTRTKSVKNMLEKVCAEFDEQMLDVVSLQEIQTIKESFLFLVFGDKFEKFRD